VSSILLPIQIGAIELPGVKEAKAYCNCAGKSGPPSGLAMDLADLRRLRSSLACTGGLRQACALGCPSSRAVCIPCGLRHRSCIRLAADITLRLAPSCYILQSSCPVNLLLALQIAPVSLASASTSGLRLPLRSLAVLSTGFRLAPTSRLPRGLAISFNSHRVPHT